MRRKYDGKRGYRVLQKRMDELLEELRQFSQEKKKFQRDMGFSDL